MQVDYHKCPLTVLNMDINLQYRSIRASRHLASDRPDSTVTDLNARRRRQRDVLSEEIGPQSAARSPFPAVLSNHSVLYPR